VENGSVVGVFGLADPAHEPTAAAGTAPHLTPRQQDVLRYLAAGSSTAQIAARLGIANETVRNHVRGIMQRLGVHSRLEAVLRAHELGLA
jgi:DNA-binding NarL/FixJ family response regulator